MRTALRTTLITAFAAAAVIAVPLTARAVASDSNDDIPLVRGAAVVGSPVAGQLTAGTDFDDVYRVRLTKDQWFYASLKGGDNDFDLMLFDDSATSVAGTVPAVAFSETKGSSSERFFYKVAKTGDYYLDAYAFDGNGSYTLTYGTPSADRPWLSASTPTPAVKWGGTGIVTGQMRNSAGVLANRTVYLYSASSRSKSIAKTTTDANGIYTFAVKPTRKMSYVVRYLGGTDYLISDFSSAVSVSPYASLTRPSVPSKTVRRNVTFTSVGYLKPRHTPGAKSVKVRCYLKNSAGKYVWVKTFLAKNSNYRKGGVTYTKYTARVKLPKKGAWKIVAYTAGDSTHLATTSAARYKTVK